MSRLIVSLVLLFTTFHAQADKDSMGSNLNRLSRVDDMARVYVDGQQLPGVLYGVVRAGGVAHTGSVGVYTRKDLFRIFSMTKPVTAVATLMLFEDGKLLLTDPVSRYLPEFASTNVMQEDGSLRPATSEMTIRHLLTHTAGLTYGGYNTPVSDMYVEAGLWEADSLSEFSHQVAALPLVADPGTRWRYSVSLDILGRVIEVVSGQTLDTFFEERIFKPLGMPDTAFSIDEAEIDRLLPLYRYKEGAMSAVDQAERMEYVKPRFPAGGGGLVSTLDDYMRFARMLLGNGELDGVRLLSRKTVDLMMADHLLAMDPALQVNESWLGNTENRNGRSDQLGFGYGLGGAVIRDPVRNGVPGSKHTYGWGGNANTYFFVDRAENISGIFFTQLQPSGTYPVRAQFRTLVYQSLD